MSKVTLSKKLAPVIAVGALLAACAAVDTGVGWNIPPVGSTWQVSQRNTGSYGKDVTFQATRGESVWQGQQVVTLHNSANGATVLALPNGKWVAILGRDGKPSMTFDPPVGYVFPLSVGQSWSTKHKVTQANGSVSDFTYSCKVEGRESVTVPAGTFDTMRIVCESPVQRDVNWMTAHGMHAKQELQRLAGHPQGPGTQQSQLMALNRRS